MTAKVTVSGAVFASALAMSAASVDAREMSLATYISANSSFVMDLLTPWTEWINERSGDEFHIQVYAGGTLGRDPNQQDRIVSSGIADISIIVPGRNPGVYPHYSMFELPGYIRSAEEGSFAAWQLHLDGILETGDNLKVLTVWTSDPYIIHGRDPITQLGDIAGRRFRVLGQTQTDTVLALGGVPQAVSITETPEAISRGTLDGSLADWAVFDVFGIGEVAHHSFTLPLGVISFSTVMNPNSYAELSPAAQALLAEAGEEWQRRVVAYYGSERSRIHDLYHGRGHITIDATDAEIEAAVVATAPQRDAVVATIGDAVMNAFVERLEAHRARR